MPAKTPAAPKAPKTPVEEAPKVPVERIIKDDEIVVAKNKNGEELPMTGAHYKRYQSELTLIDA